MNLLCVNQLTSEHMVAGEICRKPYRDPLIGETGSNHIDVLFEVLDEIFEGLILL